MINIFCETTPTKLTIFTSKLLQRVISRGVKNVKVLAGSFFNGLNQDVSISLIQINQRMLNLLEAPTMAPFWSNGTVGISRGSSQGYKSRLRTEFEVIENLGSGASGDVFLFRNILDLNQYAIKETVLKNHEEVPIEVVALSTLKHTNIVSYNQAWVERRTVISQREFRETDDILDRCVYLQMEHCSKSLHNIIEKGYAFKKKWAWRVFMELTSALEYTHDKRFVHGDLSASNVFFDLEDHVRLADFDMAFCQDKHYNGKSITFSAPLDKDEVLNNTYRAPEALNGKNLTDKVDIYSLGIICSTLFAVAEEGQEIYYRMIAEANARMKAGQLPTGLEEYTDLGDFLLGMCAEDPSLRPTATEILERLNAYDLELDKEE